MFEEELGKKNRQRFKFDMSEVDFTLVVIVLPNWSKLPSCIIQYEQIMKNVRRISISLKDIVRSRIIIRIQRDLDLI